MKNHSVLSIATLQAYLFTLVGLLFGILYSFGGLLIDAIVTVGWIDGAAVGTPGLSYGTLLAFGALVGMPLIGAISGFVLGIVEGILYSLVKKYIPSIGRHF